MKRIAVVVLALAACSSPARAPGTSAGFVSEPRTIGDGTYVEIVELGEADDYYDRRDELVGRICLVVGGGLEPLDDYYMGTASCADGNSYYFYQVRVAVTGWAEYEAQHASLRSWADADDPPEPPTAPSTEPSAGAPPPPPPRERYRGSTIPDGSRFTIVEVHAKDAFYDDRGKIENLQCVASGELEEEEPGYYGGSADCDDGKNYEFYKVAVILSASSTDASNGASPPRERYRGATIPDGSRFTIVEVAAADAYYSDRARVENLQCVATGELEEKDPGFYRGGARCDDGNAYFFHSIAVILAP